MKYPYDLRRRLGHAISDGSQATRLELGIARMSQRENGREGRGGSWYVARRAEPLVVLDGKVQRFQLLGEVLEDDHLTRRWVDTLGEAQEYVTYRDAMSACALQREGVPMHEREARRVGLGTGDLILSAGKGAEL